MARSSIHLSASVDDAWSQLQLLDTWEGVAGIEDLRDPTHDAEGDLSSFRFAINTAMGRIGGRATVAAQKPRMVISGEQKGLVITISIELREAEQGCDAEIEAAAKASSFLSMPLELALNPVLDAGLSNEAARIATRVQPTT